MTEVEKSDVRSEKPSPPRSSGDDVSLDTLLAQLDLPREARRTRDLRPLWLHDLTDCVADLFEPLAHAGRVGFECIPDQGRWNLSFYLAAAEHIGGPLDGHVEPINFSFNIAALMKCFERVDKCEWRVFPAPESIGFDGVSRTDIPNGLSSLHVRGIVMTEAGLGEVVAIDVHSLPPKAAGIGLKLFANGDIEPTN